MISVVLRSKNSIKNLLKMFLLDLFDAVYACCMASACELFFKECVDHSERYAQAYHTLTEFKDLCIVMLKLFVFYLLRS